MKRWIGTLALWLGTTAAIAAPGDTHLVSINEDAPLDQLWGGNADSETRFAGALSHDGRHAVFSSAASNLVPDDDNGLADVFLRDRQTGTTVRISVGQGGGEANGASGGGVITPDGRFVAFHSDASNLVADDSNGLRDVFVHDRQTGTTTLVSVDPAGQPFADNMGWPRLSADGRHVVFERLQFHSPSILAGGAFAHDRQTGTTEELGTQLQGEEPLLPSISDDGRHIVYVTFFEDGANVYHYDRTTQNTTALLSTFADATGSISPDGRFVVLVTNNNFGGQQWNYSQQVYLHNLETGARTLVSVDNGGSPGNGDSGTRGVSLSADSRYVSFTSDSTNLVGGDTNGTTDVFVHDRVTRATARVSVSSTGGEAESISRTLTIFEPRPGSYAPTLSGDGATVLFTSDAINLALPTMPDLDEYRDVFLHELGPLPGVPPFTQNDQGLVAFEAEHFYISLPGQSHYRPLEPGEHLEPWTVIDSAAASGGAAILADPFWQLTARKPESPVSGYSIEFKQAGPHYVWVRGRATSADSDRLGVNLNWGPPLNHFVKPTNGQWVWTRNWSVIDVPSPGVHQLWLYRREGGVEIDKVVVTPEEAFKPTGFGPAENPQSGSNAAPMLTAIGDQQVLAGQTLELTLAASDPDGDPLTFTAPDLPAFATLSDQGNGTATLTFAPGMADAGSHDIRVLVSDDSNPPLSAEETFQLQVVASAFRQAAGGTLSIEAEHFDAALPGQEREPWSVAEDSDASGGQLVRADDHWKLSPIETGPPVNEYHVHFNRSGPHYVWIRARAFSPKSDAFYLALDDAPVIKRYAEPDNGEWVWRREWRQVDVDAPGLHTLRIYRRERNVEIDKIMLTPWSGYAPSGIGPEESPRN